MARIHIDQLVKNLFVSSKEDAFEKNVSAPLQILPIEFYFMYLQAISWKK